MYPPIHCCDLMNKSVPRHGPVRTVACNVLLSAGNDLDALRQRVSQQLLAAAEDGRLEKAMQKHSEVRMGPDGPRVLGEMAMENGLNMAMERVPYMFHRDIHGIMG